MRCGDWPKGSGIQIRGSKAILPLLYVGILACDQGPIMIRAGRLIDGRGVLQHNVTVVIDGSLIRRVEAESQLPPTYDLSDFTVLPGLIDTHVHIGGYFEAGRTASDWQQAVDEHDRLVAENARATLMAGFTTVQSIGAAPDRRLQEEIMRGRIVGPRIMTSLGSFADTMASPDQIRRYVRAMVAAGAEVVKVYASKSSREGGAQTLSDVTVQAACDEARRAGVRTWVHAHAASAVRAAALAGCTAVTHGTQVTDTELGLMAARGTYFEPNIGLVVQNYVENKPRFLGIRTFDEDGFRRMEASLPLAVAAFRRSLQYPGLKVIMGTDATAGAHGQNAREIIYRVKEGGQAPMDAIRAATSLNAEALRLGDSVGAIATGLQADLIAVEGNPLTDIDALRKVVFVMRAGKVYKNMIKP